MADSDLGRSVLPYLFADEETRAYAVLDGASIPDLLDVLYDEHPEFECLYRGTLEPDIAEVAPYLVRLQPDARFTEWVLATGWGKHWGVFALAPLELDAIRRHFRRFMIVHDPDGKPLYFRYYDPRVLRVYLPTCTSEELSTIFGEVQHFVIEGDDPTTALRFGIADGALRQEKLPVRST